MRRALHAFGALGVVVLLLVPTAKVSAAGEASNITTSPISVDLQIRPGETKTTTLQVQNNGPRTVDIKVDAATFTARGSDGQAAISPKRDDPSLKWLSFSPSVVTAEPGVWKQVQMTVTVPKDASLGYYYAILFKPILAVDKTVKNTNTYTPTNAILALLDTSTGNETRQLQISSFTSTKKLYEYLPATFKLDIYNSGNIYIAPRGTINISKDSSFKSSIQSIDFNTSSGRVLPKSHRVFTVVWKNGFPVFQDKTSNGQPVTNKKGVPLQELKWDFSNTDKLRFGKYYARATVVYNNGQRDVPIYAVVSFWVIPWKILLVVALIVALQVLLIVALVRYRTMYRKSRKKA